MNGHYYYDPSANEQEIRSVAEDMAANRSKKEKKQKFSEWSTEERAALKDLPVDVMTKNSTETDEHTGRSLNATGNGYTAICNPFLGTCTCN
jgi:hypothetical protein